MIYYDKLITLEIALYLNQRLYDLNKRSFKEYKKVKNKLTNKIKDLK